MSRQQPHDSEAAAVPDKAMLATVLNYLKNKNLKETEEVLKKELSGQGDDSIVSLHSISAVGQSGAEPMKYEESYISKAPFPATLTTSATAAYLEQQDDAVPKSASSYHSENDLESLQNSHLNQATRIFSDPIDSEASSDGEDDDDEDDPPPAKRMSPLMSPFNTEHGNISESTAAVMAKMLDMPPPPALVAASTAKTLDSKPSWLQNPLLSTAASSSLFMPSSMANPISQASATGGKPMILPGATVPAAQSSQNIAICAPPMMYQIVSPTCMARPLGPVLTVLKSPPSLGNSPSMFLTNPLSAVNQNLALQSVMKPAMTAPEKITSDLSTAVTKVTSPIIAEPATGQAIPQPEFSPVTSTTSSTPHPRTLASIPPSELTPQLIELKAFAEDFKTRRIRLGFTQGSVGQSLAEKGYNNFAQSTISRFEQMQLSPANAATIRVILEKWLLEAESPEPATTTSATIPQMTGRKRKKRAVFTSQTRSILEECFAQNPRPNRQSIEGISQKLELLPEEVRVWFCNKRQKSKSGGNSVHRISFDCESSHSTTSSSGVPSPTLSDGGMSQKRSPSPPKTPFTIEELSKSSIANPMSSPINVSTPSALSPLAIMASVTQSKGPLFSIAGASFNNPSMTALIQSNNIANTRA